MALLPVVEVRGSSLLLSLPLLLFLLLSLLSLLLLLLPLPSSSSSSSLLSFSSALLRLLFSPFLPTLRRMGPQLLVNHAEMKRETKAPLQ
jgi:hypothetical protein